MCHKPTDGHKYCSHQCYAQGRSNKNRYAPGTSRCSCCKQVKPIEEFSRSKKSSNGVTSWCKNCYKTRSRPLFYYICVNCYEKRSRIKRHTEEIEALNVVCQSCKRKMMLEKNNGIGHGDTGREHFSGRTYSAWFHSAKRRKYVWDVTKDDLEKLYSSQNGLCALTGLKMEARKRRSPLRPSIDRIDPSMGYSLGNIQFVCSVVNVMKNKYNELAFVSLCKLVYFRNEARFGLSKISNEEIVAEPYKVFGWAEDQGDGRE